MYIERVPNLNSPPAVLLRESYREAGRVKKRTLANLSHLPDDTIERLRRVLRGDALGAPQDAFDITHSRPHGHVAAVLGTLEKLGLDRLLAARRSPERDRAAALIVSRVLAPDSKLATARAICPESATSTLGEMLDLGLVEADDLYAAMDWLGERQTKIEKALAKRHLYDGTLVLYDVNSSYFEGRHCPLARIGHSRDGKQGSLQIVFGLLCNAEGCPVAIEVYEGNTGDPTTVGRAFRCMKTVDLHVRPIHHRLEERVRAHVLLCMLVYYVEWHMRRAWAPLLFAEDDLEGAARRRVSPAKPAARSESAEAKALTKKTAQGEPVHRFRGLLAHLATLTKNTIQPEGGLPTFDQVTVPTSLQKRAFDLLEVRVPV